MPEVTFFNFCTRLHGRHFSLCQDCMTEKFCFMHGWSWPTLIASGGIYSSSFVVKIPGQQFLAPCGDLTGCPICFSHLSDCFWTAWMVRGGRRCCLLRGSSHIFKFWLFIQNSSTEGQEPQQHTGYWTIFPLVAITITWCLVHLLSSGSYLWQQTRRKMQIADVCIFSSLTYKKVAAKDKHRECCLWSLVVLFQEQCGYDDSSWVE